MGFWELFKNAIFIVIDWLYSWCGDWGLAIILITVIFRILIFPITMRQNKSTLVMQKLQPKIKEIQEKYADDRTRQSEELQKVYAEAKYNPLSGCLPMLLQMPIFMALYQVLRELSNLITQSGRPDDVLPATFYNLLPDLSLSASTVFAFTAEAFVAAIPYLVMMLLFSLSMLVPALINRSGDRNTLIMTGVMSVMMLWFGWTVPAGVLLYWDTSALIGIGQTLITKKMNEHKEATIEEEMVEIKPVKVEVERKERKTRPRKNK